MCRHSKKEETCIYVQLTHFSVQWKLTQHCKQLNPNKSSFKKPEDCSPGRAGAWCGHCAHWWCQLTSVAATCQLTLGAATCQLTLRGPVTLRVVYTTGLAVPINFQ